MRETRLTSTQPSRHIERSEKENHKGKKKGKRKKEKSAQETRGKECLCFGTTEISTLLKDTPESLLLKETVS